MDALVKMHGGSVVVYLSQIVLYEARWEVGGGREKGREWRGRSGEEGEREGIREGLKRD